MHKRIVNVSIFKQKIIFVFKYLQLECNCFIYNRFMFDLFVAYTVPIECVSIVLHSVCLCVCYSSYDTMLVETEINVRLFAYMAVFDSIWETKRSKGKFRCRFLSISILFILKIGCRTSVFEVLLFISLNWLCWDLTRVENRFSFFFVDREIHIIKIQMHDPLLSWRFPTIGSNFSSVRFRQ